MSCDPTLLGSDRGGVHFTSQQGSFTLTDTVITNCDVVLQGRSSTVTASGIVCSNTGGGSTINIETNEGTVQVCVCVRARWSDPV